MRWTAQPGRGPGTGSRARQTSGTHRLLLALHRCSSSRSCLGGSTGYERSTLCVRGDVLLWVALQASLMAECLADGAGDADCGIGVSELVGASHVSEHAADGDFGLGHAGCSSCRRWPEGHRVHLISSCCYLQSITAWRISDDQELIRIHDRAITSAVAAGGRTAAYESAGPSSSRGVQQQSAQPRHRQFGRVRAAKLLYREPCMFPGQIAVTGEPVQVG